MRYFFVFGLLLILISCNGNDPKKNVDKAAAPAPEEPSTDQWITALRQFQQAMINNDEDEMLALFPFPIDETHFYTIVHADTLSESFAARNNGNLTRAFVEKHFKTFYEVSGIKDLNTVIHRINFDKLRDHGLLDGEDHRSGEACYRHYSIKLSGDEATITFGKNADDEYLRTHPDEDMACGEFTYFLRLKLVNNHLTFNHIELIG